MQTHSDSTIDTILDRLRAQRPTLHTRGDRLVDYGIDPYLLSFLRRNITAGQRTIETGSGLSTMIFLLMGAHHTAVSPDPGEPERIRASCTQYGIPTDGYSPVVGESEQILPSFALSAPFDVTLIDGNHAFPSPCLDWFYMTRMLKKGGMLILDDLQLWSCRMLADFMDAEPVWERVTRSERVGAYRMLDDAEAVLHRGWVYQQYVTRRSKSWTRVRVERQFHRIGRWLGVARSA